MSVKQKTAEEIKKAKRKKYQKEYHKFYGKINKRTSIRVNQVEYDYFKKIADQEKTSVPTLIKTMALAQIGKTFYKPKKIQKKLDKLIFLIRNIANNLNQVARNSNTIKRVTSDDKNKVFSTLLELENLIKNIED